MIRYSLTCKAGHGFESWFQNAGAFTALLAAGQLSCPICGTGEVEKSLMAPNVVPARNAAAGPSHALTQPQTELETAIATLRRQIEENSDYVGMNFAAEARRMHSGDAPERAIHGEARPDEARALIEDGVPVAPLHARPSLPACTRSARYRRAR
jgi:hypothetical protein